jgi:S1-C subfamily serine protease
MHIIKRSIGHLMLAGVLSLTGIQMTIADQLNDVPVSAPIDTDSAGRAGDIATHSVVRLLCPATNLVGTGFLHKSGNIITADHVVRDCQSLQMILPDGRIAPVTTMAMDQDHDLALVKPSVEIKAAPLPLASGNDFKVGTQVSTWGFPAGYFGLAPMLSVGYLAGIDAFQLRPGTIIRQWIVNAAFNGGNSGGPLVHVETGAVFGVVSSKLAPLSKESVEILRALEANSGTGIIYNAKDSNGKDVTFTEGQLVGKVLNELRRQVQLVIGKAVLLEDIKTFLTANKIEP